MRWVPLVRMRDSVTVEVVVAEPDVLVVVVVVVVGIAVMSLWRGGFERGVGADEARAQ
jgi:hypothetical protein